MMPDLGKYADIVMSAYFGALLLLCALIGVTIWKGRRVKAQLRAIEARAND